MSRALTATDLDAIAIALPAWVTIDADDGPGPDAAWGGARLVQTRFGDRLVIPLLLLSESDRGVVWIPIGSYWPSPRSKAILDAKLGTQYDLWAGASFPLLIVRNHFNPFTRTRRDVLAVAPADEWESLRAHGAGAAATRPAD